MATTLNNIAQIDWAVNGVNFNKFSNQTTFTLQTAILNAVKTNTPTIGQVGTVVTFTIVINNTSATDTANTVILTDNLTGAGFTYVVGTAKVNGVASAQTPGGGINCGNILPLATTTVTFNATVN